jgi:phosphoglycolate phosphatase-like HAD superfamily hydrolase
MKSRQTGRRRAAATRKPSVRLVLFDIDGTLLHTHRAGVRAFAKTFTSHFGLPDVTERIQFAGRTDVSLVRQMFAIAGRSAVEQDFERFFAIYVFWLDHLLSETGGSICPGVHDFLKQLQAQPSPPIIGLLTGNIRLGAEIKLRHFGLWETFHVGAFADDAEDRDHIAAVARDRGSRALGSPLRGEEIVVIGDTPHDVRCGRAIGAKVLAVATGGSTLAQLREHQPDWLVSDLSSLDAAEVCA